RVCANSSPSTCCRGLSDKPSVAVDRVVDRLENDLSVLDHERIGPVADPAGRAVGRPFQETRPTLDEELAVLERSFPEITAQFGRARSDSVVTPVHTGASHDDDIGGEVVLEV